MSDRERMIQLLQPAVERYRNGWSRNVYQQDADHSWWIFQRAPMYVNRDSVFHEALFAVLEQNGDHLYWINLVADAWPEHGKETTE